MSDSAVEEVPPSVTDYIRATGVGEGVNLTAPLHVTSDATAKTRRTAIILVLFSYGGSCSANLRRR